jgi:hypothetical protein
MGHPITWYEYLLVHYGFELIGIAVLAAMLLLFAMAHTFDAWWAKRQHLADDRSKKEVSDGH